jgi:hypothetical protein
MIFDIIKTALKIKFLFKKTKMYSLEMQKTVLWEVRIPLSHCAALIVEKCQPIFST